MFMIGDVHGKFKTYNKLIRSGLFDRTIQVGDMGIGFKNHKGEIKDGEFPSFGMSHRFIVGNHDNREECRKYPNYLGDYGYLEDDGIFYLGGAYSIDVDMRTEGINWWHDEELSYSQFNEAFQIYVDNKPDIVVTHEAPFEIVKLIYPRKQVYRHATNSALDAFFGEHKPSQWIFGHHHIHWQSNVLGTEFVCVPELEVYDSIKMEYVKWRNC